MTENTVIQTGFGADSTIWDVIAGVDLTGARAIVTGASSASASRPPGHWPPWAPR